MGFSSVSRALTAASICVFVAAAARVLSLRSVDPVIVEMELQAVALGTDREIATRPISAALWTAVAHDERAPACDAGHCTASDISWAEAVRFCNALSRASGLEPAYAIEEYRVVERSGANGYRLPHVDEIRVAAEPGSRPEFAWNGYDFNRGLSLEPGIQMDEMHDVRTIMQGTETQGVSVRNRVEGTVFRVVRAK